MKTFCKCGCELAIHGFYVASRKCFKCGETVHFSEASAPIIESDEAPAKRKRGRPKEIKRKA
jgi:hypothetical protein